MVQILPPGTPKKPSFGAQAGTALQRAMNLVESHLEKKQKAEALQGMGIDPRILNAPPEVQKAYAQKIFSGEKQETQLQEAQRNKIIAEIDEIKNRKSFMDKISPQKKEQQQNDLDFSEEDIIQSENLGIKGLRESQNAKIKAQQQEEKTAKEYEKRVEEKKLVKDQLRKTGDYDEEELENLSEFYDVPTARAEYQKKKLEPSPYEPTSAKLAAERTSKFIDKSEEQGNAADIKLRGLEEGFSLHKQGATGFKVTNWLADFFGIPSLADPKSKAFNASMKSQYTGIGDIVKGKVSNFEFQTFQGRIAQAEDSPQAAEVLMISAMMESEISRKQRDIVNEKRMKYYEEGKEPPPNFDIEVLNELRPYADLILHQTNDKIRDVVNPTKKSRPNQETLNQIWGT